MPLFAPRPHHTNPKAVDTHRPADNPGHIVRAHPRWEPGHLPGFLFTASSSAHPAGRRGGGKTIAPPSHQKAPNTQNLAQLAHFGAGFMIEPSPGVTVESFI